MANRVIFLILALVIFACNAPGKKNSKKNTGIDLSIAKWHGPAISYSGYREGQNPQTFVYPSQKEVTEDLKILEKNWRLIRMYGSDQHSADALAVIRREKINLKGAPGALALGLVSGLVASQCATPVLAAILTYVMARQEALVYGAALLFVYALGRGVPVVLAGSFTGVVKQLQSFGRWSPFIEKASGVIILGVGLYFLWLA